MCLELSFLFSFSIGSLTPFALLPPSISTSFPFSPLMPFVSVFLVFLFSLLLFQLVPRVFSDTPSSSQHQLGESGADVRARDRICLLCFFFPFFRALTVFCLLCSFILQRGNCIPYGVCSVGAFFFFVCVHPHSKGLWPGSCFLFSFSFVFVVGTFSVFSS